MPSSTLWYLLGPRRGYLSASLPLFVPSHLTRDVAEEGTTSQSEGTLMLTTLGVAFILTVHLFLLDATFIHSVVEGPTPSHADTSAISLRLN